MELHPYLSQVPLFEGLLPAELLLVAGRLELREFTEGSLVLTRGLPPQELFIILEGRVQVELAAGKDQVIHLTELGPGGVVGERAMLTDQRRSSDVRAVTTVRAARLAREDFEALLGEVPTLYANLCRILAGQIGSWAQRHRREEREHRELMSSIIGNRLFPEYERYPGNSPWGRDLNLRLSALGASRRHVLILGEPGTWKDLAARLVHEGAGSPCPLLFLDCSAPPVPAGTQEPAAAVGTAQELPLAQRAALFGSVSDPGASSRRTRRGMVEMADGGDLILRHVDRLAPEVQQELAQFLETGQYRRVGDARARSARIRVIASSGKTLPHLAQAENFHPALWAGLGADTVRLAPLRERRKDIPGVARELLRTVCAKHRTKVPRLSQDALNLLVEHDWPLNGTELYQVLSRAVLVCGEGEILPEHISLHGQQTGEGRFNLLGLAAVENLVRSASFPGRLRWLTVPLFLALLLFLLLGPSRDNPANLAAWTLGWPGLVLGIVFLARGWCSICPIESIGALCAGPGQAVHQQGRRLRDWAPAASFLGLVLVLLLEQGTGMFTRPRATGLLLAGILAGSALGDRLFGRRGWCKFLCPLGRLIGLLARMSLLEMHGNHNVCLSRCRVEECVKEKGCPMGLHPAGLDGSDHCLLCMECLRNCPHRSMQLDLRHPCSGLLGRTRRGVTEALCCVMLVALVLAIKVVPLTGAPDGGSFIWGGWDYLRAVGVLLGYPALVAAACVPARPRRWRRVFTGCGPVYLPLAGAGLFMVYFRPLVEHGAELVPQLLALLRLDGLLEPAALTPEFGTLRLLYYPLILAALGFSWHTLNRLQKRDNIGTAAFYCQRALLLATAALLLIIL